MIFFKKFLKIFEYIVLLFLTFNIILYAYCFITPKISINKKQSYYLYDNNNNAIFNDSSKWIKLEDISPYVIQATVSTEDKFFYRHLGFDYMRIFKAAINNITSMSLSEGASTITQQYARNLFLNYDKTWNRKFDEALVAAELETHYTKNEILEGYLNTINYGGVYGIENASWYYFGHSASDLSLAEASMLAGIPQSPANYSPLINSTLAKKRQKSVLKSMYKNNKIDKSELKEAYSTKLKYLGKEHETNLENALYFRDAVLKELDSISSVPKTLIETGELNIYTTLDTKAQEDLENSVKNNMKDSNDNLQVAGLMMNPDNGGVMAMIGGKNYSSSQFNRAISSKRQVGSIMKPILYYSALENGFTSASTFISEKTTFNFSNNQKYMPKNYNDIYANGPITMGAAIAYSDNTYAIKTNLFMGEKNLLNMSKRLGIKSNLKAVPSLALGTGEISMIEMAEAYSSFANMGYKIESHFIDKVLDKDGNILYKYNNVKDSILNSNLTYILSEMLTYTYDQAFIDYSYPTLINLYPKITQKYAIKSGTTDTDMWIIGYNKKSVLAIWNGYDDNKVITSKNGYHKDIWIDTMESYLKQTKKEDNWYNMPKDVVGVMLNPITGTISTNDDKKSKVYYFLKGTEPTDETIDLESVFREEINTTKEN